MTTTIVLALAADLLLLPALLLAIKQGAKHDGVGGRR